MDEGDAGPLPAVMEAFARPTRIVRGKEVNAAWRVDPARFEMDEERALHAAFEQVSRGVTSSMGIRNFLQVRGWQWFWALRVWHCALGVTTYPLMNCLCRR